MTKHKKIIDDAHYGTLVDSIIKAMQNSSHFKMNELFSAAIRSRDMRMLYHATMRQVVQSISNRLKLKHPIIDALMVYHDDLIAGNVNHQHPKNIYSELLKASGGTKDQLHKLGFNLCMLTIPIDGEYPIKLVEAINTDALYELSNLEGSFMSAYSTLFAHS